MKIARIAEALRTLQDHINRGEYSAQTSRFQGICGNTESLLRVLVPDEWQALKGRAIDSLKPSGYQLLTNWLRAGFAAWPEFSGEFNYPVPASDDFESDDEGRGDRAEQQYDNTDHQYDASTAYGRSRLALLSFLIDRADSQEDRLLEEFEERLS